MLESLLLLIPATKMQLTMLLHQQGGRFLAINYENKMQRKNNLSIPIIFALVTYQDESHFFSIPMCSFAPDPIMLFVTASNRSRPENEGKRSSEVRSLDTADFL